MILALVCACLACARAGDGAGSATDVIDAEALPQLDLVEVQRFGSTDDAQSGFTNIGAVVGHPDDGEVYAVDLGSLSVRVFSPDGTFLRALGRRGSGPGEFRGAPRLGVRGDTVWTIEHGTRRITLFTRHGTLLSASQYVPETVALQPVDRFRGLEGMPRGLPFTVSRAAASVQDGGMVAGALHPGYMVGSGRFLSTLLEVRADPSTRTVRATDTVRVPRLVFDATGAVVDTVGWERVPLRRSCSSTCCDRDRSSSWFLPHPRMSRSQ
jgi:hypothetical protein